MRLGGHVNPRIFRKHYQPRETIDGPANFHNQEQMTDVLQASQQLNIPYIPNLLQSLPAKELYELQQGAKYKELQEQIEAETNLKEISRLQRKQEALKLNKLKQLRANQRYDDPPGYEHEVYSRVRFMLPPERLRLEESLFEEAESRSPIWIQTLKDLVALGLRSREVEVRPGLEPSLCSCPKNTDGHDWRHILNCHKNSQTQTYGFAEFCFRCNLWIYDGCEWENHCAWHITNLIKLPVWVDPLIYDAIFIDAGRCEICLVNPKLSATVRMHQFTWLQSWQKHYQTHYEDPKLKLGCRCQSWDSLLEFQFHLHDCHGAPMPITSSRRCHQRQHREPKRKRQKTCKDERNEARECLFFNSTPDSIASSLSERTASRFSPKLPSSEPDGNKIKAAKIADSSYLDIDLTQCATTSGPYYSGCVTSKYEETEFVKIEDIPADTAVEPRPDTVEINKREQDEGEHPAKIGKTNEQRLLSYADHETADRYRSAPLGSDFTFDINTPSLTNSPPSLLPHDPDTPSFDASTGYNTPIENACGKQYIDPALISNSDDDCESTSLHTAKYDKDHDPWGSSARPIEIVDLEATDETGASNPPKSAS
jgi:hypothetical protein